MFNRDIKLEYLDLLTNKAQLAGAKTLFALMEQVEDELEKDCGSFDKEEIVYALEASLNFNIRVLLKCLNDLRFYKLWFNDNIEYCPVSGIDETLIDRVDFKRMIKNSLFLSEDQFIAELNDGSQMTGNIANIVLLLAWYGIDGGEARKLKKADITYGESTAIIQVGSRSVEINNPAAVKMLRDYSSMRTFQKAFSVNEKEYVEDNSVYLLRKFSNADKKADKTPEARKVSLDLIYTRIYILNEDRPKKITVKTASLSGEFFRLYNAKLSGKDTTSIIRETNQYAKQSELQGKIQLFGKYCELREEG